jgi:uncharacterized protein YneF (UPF0154 family)
MIFHHMGCTTSQKKWQQVIGAIAIRSLKKKID